MDMKYMQHKNLKYYYCRENCVFFDTCKANIGQCIIFKMEQLLYDLVLKEFELEIFRLNFRKSLRKKLKKNLKNT